jgi:hypothetical protein
MDSNIFKTTHSCLPVTALQALRLKRTSLILSGQGPFLRIIEPQSRTLLACQRVLASSSVHGLACESSHEQKNTPRDDLKSSFHRDSVSFAKVLVWGGSSVSVARFQISYEEYGTVISKTTVDGFEVGPTAHVHDWILDGSFASGDSWSEVQACLVSAHNDFVALPLQHAQRSLLDVDFLRRNPSIYGISTSSKPLLYSARVRPLPAGSFSVLSGTAFGNICVGKTQLAEHSSQCVEFSTGHQGITFGVDQSDKWLATCSDDRGVRLGTFGAATSLGEEWRHTSRVWGVKFIRTSTGALCLVSVGEDSSCKVQQITREGLVELVDDRYHSGKNIWSVADAYIRLDQVVTGGADGAIVSRDVLENAAASHPKAAGSRFEHERAAFTSLFAKLDIHAVIKSGSNIKPPAVKQYVFISHSCLLALTDSGYLFSIAKKHLAPVDNCENDGGQRTTPAHELLIFSKWSVKRKCLNPFGERPVLSDSQDHLVFVGDGSGNLFACFPAADKTAVRLVTQLDMPISWLAIAAVRHSSDLRRECCIVVYCDRKKLAKVVVAQLPMHIDETAIAQPLENRPEESAGRSGISPETSSHPEIWSLELPEDFVPTSARLLNLTRVLVLGSRRSALAIYRPTIHMKEQHSHVPLSPFYRCALHVRHVHGSDSVTSIRGIPPTQGVPDCNSEHFLTTGRNGTYVVHSVILQNHSVTSEVQDIATSPVRFGVEGSYCSPTQETEPAPDGSPRKPSWGGRYEVEGGGPVKHGELILYGFDSEKFVIWNESRQSLIFSIECGNIHRAWAYNKYAFELPPSNGSLAWSQAGSLHLVTIDQTDHSTIQQGGHGREIKALSVSPLPFNDYRHGISSGTLVATGAEDTTIRLFAVGSNVKADAWNKLTLLRTVKKHNTGIQCLSFSLCGRYLFSSGGCEELFAWRIRHNVPGVNVGVVLDFTFPEDTPNSDLRITDFKIQDHHLLSGTFVVSAVYSNSMVKVFYFRPAESDPTQRCQSQKRFFYKQNCLTQINHDLAAGILTAATDGHLVFWPIGAEEHNPNYPHRVHQNSIQSMRTIDLPLGNAALHEQLVITGGDDNALSLTLIRISADGLSRVNFPKAAFQSLQIPKAHAAAITATCVLSVSTSEPWVTVRFLSASNDQRVRLWQARIALDKLGDEGAPFLGGSADMAAVEVDFLASTETSVADVGAMEQISKSEGALELVHADDAHAVRHPDGVKPMPEAHGLARVMIVGVGMEVLEFPAEKIDYD